MPSEALLVMLVSYWPAPTEPPKGLCTGKDAVRSWPGETGSAKVSGNYTVTTPLRCSSKAKPNDAGVTRFYGCLSRRGTSARLPRLTSLSFGELPKANSSLSLPP